MCTCHHLRLIGQARVHLQLAEWETEEIVAHDHDCNIRTAGGCCDCEPRVVLIVYDQEIRIDEDGRLMTELWN